MRNWIWELVRAKVPEGQILPWWALTARWVLFPLDSLYWRMSQTKGYQILNDTWIIEGVVYSGTALRKLAKGRGGIYQITRSGETVVLKEMRFLNEVLLRQ